MQNEETPTEVNPFMDIAAGMSKPPAAPTIPTDNPFMDLAPSVRTVSQPPAMGSLSAVAGINPDQAAEATKLGTPLGIGQDLALRNMDELRRRSMIASVQRSGMLQNNSRLAQSLLDPVFAAQAHDDLDSLEKTSSLFDKAVNFIGPELFDRRPGQALRIAKVLEDGYAIGELGAELGALKSRRKGYVAFGGTPENETVLNDRIAFLEKQLANKEPSGFFGSAAMVTAQALAMARPVGTVALMGAGVGGAVGGPPGAAAGFVAGLQAGIVGTTAQVEGGFLFDDMVAQGVEPETAYYASVAGGTVIGIIELVGDRLFAGSFKPITRFLRQELTQQLAKPTIRSAAAEFGKQTLKQMAVGGAEEGSQRLVADAFSELGKAIDGVPTDFTWSQMAKNIASDFAAGVQGSALIGAAGPGLSLMVDVRRAEAVSAQEEFFDGLDAAKKDGKLPKRNLDAYEGFLARQAKGTNADTVYVEAEAAAQVLAQSGLSAEQLEQSIPGIREQLRNALENGGDVTIPTSVYGARLAGTPLGDALRPHVRLSPEAMSVAQAQEFSRKRDALRQEAQEVLASKQETDAAFVAEAQQVEDAAYEQIRATGAFSDIESRTLASLRQAMVVVDAAEAGMTPLQYERERGVPLQVRGPQAVQEGQPLEQARRKPAPEKGVFDANNPPADVTAEGSRMAIMAVMDYEGKIYYDRAAEMHGDLLDSFPELDADLIIDGGFIRDGKYIPNTSDGGFAAIEGGRERLALVKAFAARANQSVRTADAVTQMDIDYLDAVERGDMGTAQRMVDEAARAAGYSRRGYHGLASGSLRGGKFDESKLGSNTKAASAKLGFFFGSKRTAATYAYDIDAGKAREYAQMFQDLVDTLKARVPKKYHKELVGSLQIELERKDDAFFPNTDVDESGNPIARSAAEYYGLLSDVGLFTLEDVFRIADMIGQRGGELETWAEKTWLKEWQKLAARASKATKGTESSIVRAALRMQNPLEYDYKGKRYRDESYASVIARAKKAGHDSVVLRNTYDGAGLDDILVVFNPSQIKLADPVTYDEQGNVVPLSRRFDITSPKVFEQAAMFEQAPVSPGFYSAFTNAVDAIDAKSLAPSGWKERIKGLVNKGEVKQDEVDWSGLTDWLDMQDGKVTKEAVAQFLKNNGVRVERVQLGEMVKGQMGIDDRALEMFGARYDNLTNEQMAEVRSAQEAADTPSGETKFGKYTLPGGTNYREVLITLPRLPQDEFGTYLREMQRKYGEDYVANMTEEESARLDTLRQQPAGFRSAHWDKPNVLVHFRLNDRFDADGKRVLFVEEIQSDWGQAGRKKGFASPMLSTLPAGTKLYEPGTSPYDRTMAVVELPAGIGGRSLFYGNTIEEAKAEALAFTKPGTVPLAPFVENTDGWLNLGLKHILLEATQGNYDRVAFVNGKQSADRYDLSKQVSLLSVNKQADGRYLTYIEGVDGSPLFRNRDGFSESGQKVMTAEELADTVGKDVAEQAINGKPNKDGWVDVRGDGLKVGGKGMIEFYDKIVPASVNKLLKKYAGGKIGAVVIPGAQTELRNGEIKFSNAEDVDEFLTEMSIRGFEDEDYGRIDDTTAVSFEQLNDDAFDAFSRAAEIYNGVVEVESVDVVSADAQQQPGFPVTPEMVKKLESGLPLFQAGRAPRGQFDLRSLIITIHEGGDSSTLAHELIHLRIAEYMRMARSATPSARVLGDLETLFDFMGVEGATFAERLAKYDSMPLEQRKPLEEKVTYNFEVYLYENKAPSVELRGVFDRLARWMRRAYKSIRDDLNAIYRREFGKDLPILTPEVRQVFDRMLATPEQIARAQAVRGMKAMFQTQEQSGMNDAEWAAYQALEQDATDAATAELTKATLKELQWYGNAQSKYLREMQAKHDRARKEIREEVSAQVQLEPVYRAMELLKRGIVRSETGETATAAGISKLDLATVKAMMPADFDPASLRYGKYGMVQEGGLHPDIVAEVYGFGSGVELINAILAAKPIKEEIDARTDQRMLDENSDLATPEARQAAVDMAIHNEARARFIAVEQRWLEKSTRPANDMMQAARQVAQDIIGEVVIRTLNPRRYEAAEAEAARTATTAYREPQDRVTAGRAAETKAYNEAIAAGQTPFEATVTSTQAGVEASVKATERLDEFRAKYGGREPAEVARRAKRQQLVQNQLAREAMLAKEEIDKQVKYLRRVLRDTNVKKMGAEAADQIAQLLERFEVARVSIKRLDERKALSAYLAAQEEAGLVPDIAPEIANEARRINYREMTVNQFRDLVDAVRQIEHVAKYERKMRLAQELAEFEETRDGIVARIRAVASERGLQIDPRTPLTNIGRTAAALRGFAAQHLKAASIVRILDGGEDDGPLWNAIIRTANDASNMETTMRSVAARKIGEILKPVFALGNMGGKGMFFSTIQRSLNREARIAIAMNVGNDGNRQRLLDGEGWTMEQIQPILESLTEAEWLAVQAVWDFIDGYRPEIAAKERRLYGKEPKWVEPVPFTVRTADGKNLTLQGGYYPIKYDPVASDRVATIDAVEEAKRDLQGSYTAATTRRSFTKQRANEVVGRPLLYTLDAAFTGVNDVIHDLAWHEWLISTQRLLRNEKFANAVRETRGPEFLKQLRDWAKDNATGGRGQQAAGEAVLSWLRQGISASGLGFNVVSAAMQITGFNQSIIRVGAKYIGWGITEFVSDIPGAAKRVAEKDPFMAERGRTQFREINEIKNRVRGQTDIARRVTSGTYFLMMTMQRAVDIPTWLGAYQKALDAGKDDATAVALAGQAVRDSQGSGLLADLAAVERGGPAMKLFTVFYSYMNTVYNMAAVQTMTARGRGKLAADYVMLFVVPVVLGYAIKNAIQPEPDDEEFDPEALARDLAAAELEYMMGTMIIVREFSGASKIVTGAEGVRMGYSGPAGLRLIGEAYTFTNQAAQMEFDRAFRKSAINLLGALTGIPSAQINRTIDGIDAVVEEEVEGGEAVLAPLTGVKR